MICFQYKKPDHIRTGCPLIKKDSRKKVICTTWDECDATEAKNDFYEEEGSLVCFMAFQIEVKNENFE